MSGSDASFRERHFKGEDSPPDGSHHKTYQVVWQGDSLNARQSFKQRIIFGKCVLRGRS